MFVSVSYLSAKVESRRRRVGIIFLDLLVFV